MHTPAVVIAGTHSGVGKTTISVALMAAMRRRWMRAQPFKVGRQYRVKTREGVRAKGLVAGSALASYIHLHWGSCHEIASRFVGACSHVSSLS